MNYPGDVIPFQYIQYFIFFSLGVYFLFDLAERKKIKDEREEFIKLKTFEIVQKVTLSSLVLLAVSYWLYPGMPAFVPIMVFVMTALYAEIFGKIILRRKY